MKGALNEWHRVVQTSHPDAAVQADKASKATYALQYNRCDGEEPNNVQWRTNFQFTLEQFYQADFEILHWTAARRASVNTEQVMLSLLLPPNAQGILIGRLTLLDGRITERRQGQEPVLVEFADESERIRAIEERSGVLNLPENAEEVIRKKGLALS